MRKKKKTKKPHPGNLSRSEVEPGPAAWQASMILPAPQRWTYNYPKLNGKSERQDNPAEIRFLFDVFLILYCSHFALYNMIIATQFLSCSITDNLVISKRNNICAWLLWLRYYSGFWMCICGFRARQHLRSLAPLMNDYGWWWPNDIRGPWDPKASWHLSYRWGKTLKKPHPGTCPDRESNPGPLYDKCACYHLLHSGGQTLV